jgi:adenine-specific DNA methylase
MVAELYYKNSDMSDNVRFVEVDDIEKCRAQFQGTMVAVKFAHSGTLAEFKAEQEVAEIIANKLWQENAHKNLLTYCEKHKIKVFYYKQGDIRTAYCLDKSNISDENEDGYRHVNDFGDEE